jgi:hypothetical protein
MAGQADELLRITPTVRTEPVKGAVGRQSRA